MTTILPTGLGTSAARLVAPQAGVASQAAAAPETAATSQAAGASTPSGAPASEKPIRIPELYCPPPLRDDPALGEVVNERLVEWAAEIGIYAGKLDTLREHNFGRLMMLGHPDCDDPDRLLAAARCGLSEWSVDDHYVDLEGDDAEPELIGLRLALAHAVVDPVRLPARYAPSVEKVVASEPVL
jgi:2-methylisoborneol synthase